MMKQESKISIEIVFSKSLDRAVAEAVKSGEIKGKNDLLRRLASIYKKELSRNEEFLKPLRAMDKGVSFRVIVSGD